jgi:type II secretory pathway pseudopilin PulG
MIKRGGQIPRLCSGQKGFSIMEILLVISFVAAMLSLIMGVSNFNSKTRKLNEENTQVTLYSIEAIEAVKMMGRSVLVAGDYSVDLVGDTWTISAGSQLIDGKYTRNINISNVERENIGNGHAYGDIVPSGNADPDTKKISVTIDWQSRTGSAKQEVLETYIHRWASDRWVHTDWGGGSGQASWSDETMFYTKDSGIDISIDGIVTLQSGFLDWNEATTTATFNTTGDKDDNDVYELDDIAYLVTQNNSSGHEFYVIDVSDIYNPFLLDSLNIGSTVSSVVVQGDYAYISTSRNTRELQVIDVSDPSDVFRSGEYNLPDSSNAKDLQVYNNEIYIVQDDDLYSFSINNPGDPLPLGSIGVDDDAEELFISGQYAYIATEDSDKELQIVEITNPTSLTIVGQYDLPDSLDATDVFVRGNRAYVSTKENSSGSEFFVLDISDPENPSYLGEYEVGETVHSFSIVGPYALLGTNLSNQELKVIDISFPVTITEVSSFDLDGYVLGMSANCSIIYAATSNDQGEFFIISTEVVDCDYADFGTLESSTYDTGSDQVVYNWISWSGIQPTDTEVRFQIATSVNSGGPWNYVGPDATSGTYYTTSEEYINYTNHQDERYLRYKLFLESEAAWQVPILEEAIISYSTYPQ